MLEIYDYFDGEHLEFESATIMPTWVTTGGTAYWDETVLSGNAVGTPDGWLDAGKTSTIDVTFKIKDDVPAGTEISNAVEHKLNISNQCECAQDTIPENNSDTEALIHDLALIKTLNSASTGPFKPNDAVIFDITVQNQ